MPDSADQRPDQRPDLYLERLPLDERAAYRAASPDVDLSDEIRLMRTVLSHLAADLPANHRHMTLVLGVLVRAVSLHAKSHGDASNLERTILQAAEMVLAGEE